MSVMKTKIVYNCCYGGFSLSREAVEMLASMGVQDAIDELKHDRHSYYTFSTYSERYNKDLVTVVETLGSKASGTYAQLAIREIEGDKYRIDEYDGIETVLTPGDYRWLTITDKKE